MSAARIPLSPPTRSRALPVWLAAVAIAMATVAAYHNSVSVPFIFDDLPAIRENASIRQLWPLSRILAPEQAGGITTSGRPIVNLTLALNYAVGGDAVLGYHLVNVGIHVAAALCLFGLTRRTLLLPSLNARFRGMETPLAAIVAALWSLHPLQTESVTYIVQRAESLAALFCLLTVYAFVRGAAGRPADELLAPAERPSWAWFGLSVVTCALGMATKETVAATPLLVLCYDRAFVSGAFGAAWRARRGYYLALAATWLLLAALVLATGSRGGTAGFGTHISAWNYLLTQCDALVRYASLALWPRGLTFDYGTDAVAGVGAVLPQALGLMLALVALVIVWRRHPRVGFLGIWCLALLAPSSSIVPVATQTMAEHRVYLALAGAVAAFVIGVQAMAGPRGLIITATAAVAFACATVVRNRDYQSDRAIWSDTVAKRPENARAHNNLGQALFRDGLAAEAVASYERALRLQPEYADPHYNLGVARVQLGDVARGIAHYEAALRLQPDHAEAHNNLAAVLARQGRRDEAMRHFDAALGARPDFAEAHHNLGMELLQAGQPETAIARFQRALELKPEYSEAHFQWGNALAALGRMSDALEQYRRALVLQPKYADAEVNAGNALLALGRPAEAARHYERALTVNPAQPDAHFNLGSLLLEDGRWSEAAAHFEHVLRLQPERAAAHRTLGFALGNLGRTREALAHYEQYLRARPDDTEARDEFARLRATAR